MLDEDTGDIYIWDDEEAQYVKSDTGDTDSGGTTVVYVDGGNSAVSASEMGEAVVSGEVELGEDSIASLAESIAEYETADGFNLGTTYAGIFAGVAYKVPFHQHYVYWRDSQYSYKFAYGDLTLSSNDFIGNGDVIVVDYTTSSGYNANYSYTYEVDSNFSLTVGDELVYSDLGSFPDIYNRKEAKFNAFLGYGFGVAFVWLLVSNLRKSAFGR